MGLHPLSSQDARDFRKRQLFSVWLQTPPIQVVFDAGAKGVMVRNERKDNYELRLSLNTIVSLDDKGFKANICYDGEADPEPIEIPWSAVHTIVCGPLQEHHFWGEDHALARARYEMTHTPKSKLLH